MLEIIERKFNVRCYEASGMMAGGITRDVTDDVLTGFLEKSGNIITEKIAALKDIRRKS